MSLPILDYFKKQEENEKKAQPIKISFAPPSNDSGATEIEVMQGQETNGSLSYLAPFESTFNNTRELILTYRGIAAIYEVDDAIQEIVDEAIVTEEEKETAWLNLDTTDFSDAIKKKIEEEFDYIYSTLKFESKAHKYFRDWYIDSRVCFHKVIDPQSKEIIELRQLDPINIEFIRELIKTVENGTEVITGVNEYYIYRKGNQPGTARFGAFGMGNQNDLIIPKDAIVYVYSGLTDRSCNNNIIGYLHRAIKPANQLKMLEDALVIYRLARAPERRVFYIGTGQMNARKQQQYVNQIMQGLKNRVVYDSSSGKIKNQSANMAMLEDYFLPRSSVDGKATEITTLPGGQTLGQIDDILYFNRKLYKAMRIPSSRASTEDQGGGVSFGQNTEITRDELKFIKFVRRLQNRFQSIILDPVKYQLMLKNIISADDWERNSEKIKVIFNKDSFFEEQKDLEIIKSRLEVLGMVNEYKNEYFTDKYIMKNILRYSDDEIEELEKDIKNKKNDSEKEEMDNEF